MYKLDFFFHYKIRTLLQTDVTFQLSRSSGIRWPACWETRFFAVNKKLVNEAEGTSSKHERLCGEFAGPEEYGVPESRQESSSISVCA